ncbi:YcxB family protein, partial [Acetonema longum]
NKDAFFLLTSKASAFIIPKRFLNAEEISALEALVKDKMGEKVFKGPNYIKLTILFALGFIASILCVAVVLYIIDRKI